jgi:ankyrin repeat protein
LQKDWNLLELCGKSNLEGVEADRLRQLAMDPTVGINCCNRITHDTPIMSLCRSNKSDSLLPSLKALLQREDLNLTLRNHNAHSPLTIICRFNQHHSVIDCVRLLLSRGFDLTVKDCYGRNALQLLCEFYKGENFIDIAKLLISDKMDAADLKKSLNILRDLPASRLFLRELAQLVKPLINRPVCECSEVSSFILIKLKCNLNLIYEIF